MGVVRSLKNHRFGDKNASLQGSGGTTAGQSHRELGMKNEVPIDARVSRDTTSDGIVCGFPPLVFQASNRVVSEEFWGRPYTPWGRRENRISEKKGLGD